MKPELPWWYVVPYRMGVWWGLAFCRWCKSKVGLWIGSFDQTTVYTFWKMTDSICSKQASVCVPAPLHSFLGVAFRFFFPTLSAVGCFQSHEFNLGGTAASLYLDESVGGFDSRKLVWQLISCVPVCSWGSHHHHRKSSWWHHCHIFLEGLCHGNVK